MKNIRLVILDVDGTLTDGTIFLDNHGNELKAFNARDGMAISQSIRNGLECIIMTGRKSQIVELRAKELGITSIYQSVHNKKEKLLDLISELDLTLDNIAYIGDDINDLEVMKLVGFSACPKDAVYEVKQISNYISEYQGGKGAVRDILEYLLKEQGIWNHIIEKFEGSAQ